MASNNKTANERINLGTFDIKFVLDDAPQDEPEHHQLHSWSYRAKVELKWETVFRKVKDYDGNVWDLWLATPIFDGVSYPAYSRESKSESGAKKESARDVIADLISNEKGIISQQTKG